MEASFLNQRLDELSDHVETVVVVSGEIHIGIPRSCAVSGGQQFGFRLHSFRLLEFL